MGRCTRTTTSLLVHDVRAYVRVCVRGCAAKRHRVRRNYETIQLEQYLALYGCVCVYVCGKCRGQMCKHRALHRRGVVALNAMNFRYILYIRGVRQRYARCSVHMIHVTWNAPTYIIFYAYADCAQLSHSMSSTAPAQNTPISQPTTKLQLCFGQDTWLHSNSNGLRSRLCAQPRTQP